jgi:hypothetical protein
MRGAPERGARAGERGRRVLGRPMRMQALYAGIAKGTLAFRVAEKAPRRGWEGR